MRCGAGCSVGAESVMVGSTLSVVQGCCALPHKDVLSFIGWMLVVVLVIDFIVLAVLLLDAAVRKVFKWMKKP